MVLGAGQPTLISTTNNEWLYSTSAGYTLEVNGYGLAPTSVLDSSLITSYTITNNSTGESARITGLAVPFSLSTAAQSVAELAEAATLVTGNNLIYGSNHNDTLQSFGNDTIHGGSGNDIILADNGNNVITTGAGNNSIGGYGNNTITAGAGNDLISVVSANITETGGHYNINGIGASNAIVINGSGTNLVRGGDGSIVDDGNGNDTLVALALGNHSITAGSGHNTIELRDGTVPGHILNAIINDFNPSHDVIALTAGAQMLNSGNLSSVTSHIANNASGNAVLTLGAESITFISVHAASLTASDFLLA